jgi:hypothetical protein
MFDQLSLNDSNKENMTLSRSNNPLSKSLNFSRATVNKVHVNHNFESSKRETSFQRKNAVDNDEWEKRRREYMFDYMSEEEKQRHTLI